MHIVICGRGLYFAGTAGELRRWLGGLAARRQTLAEYLRDSLH